MSNSFQSKKLEDTYSYVNRFPDGRYWNTPRHFMKDNENIQRDMFGKLQFKNA